MARLLSQPMTLLRKPAPDTALRIRRARASEAPELTELSLPSKALWGYDAAFLARCRIAMQVKEANVEKAAALCGGDRRPHRRLLRLRAAA